MARKNSNEFTCWQEALSASENGRLSCHWAIQWCADRRDLWGAEKAFMFAV